MKCTFVLLASLCFCACAAFAQPQTMAPASPSAAAMAAPQTNAPVKNPVTAALRMILPRSQKNIPAAIEAMPADKFTYKPTSDQMSFAHLVVHIAESNNSMCAKVADVPAPKVEELKETDSKDKLLAAARASFDFCSDVLGKMDDSKLGDSVELFGGRQGPRAVVALSLASSWADHYGAAAMYLRLNGILPPTARPKK